MSHGARRITTPGSRPVVKAPPIFWTHGHVEAAIQLEHLWDEIAMSRQMDILCAYPLAARDESVPAVRRLCAEHTAVEIS